MDHQGGAAVMPEYLTEERIDHQAQKYQKLLANLQGNILKGHGRDHSVHLFLKFTAPRRMVRDWVRTFAYRYVTPASQQLKEAAEFNRYRLSGALFGNFFLSAKGYESLGYTTDEIARCFNEKPALIDGREVCTIKFRDGMQFYRSELNDPDP
jgi:deferrochelatase/peroxidase EfeB